MTLSKNEELIQAILDGISLTNFTPRTRAEEYLLACVNKSGTAGLPAPQCRNELLLYELADAISNGSGTDFKTQEKEEHIYSSGEYNYTADSGYNALRSVKVKVYGSEVPKTIYKNGNYEVAPEPPFVGNLMTKASLLVRVKTAEQIVARTITKMESDDFNNIIDDDNITEIGDYAFYNCKDLESVVIPNTVTRIRNRAFAYCTSLNMINIPASVNVIEDYAFRYNDNLDIVNIYSENLTIGAEAFNIGTTTNKYRVNFINATTPPSIQPNSFKLETLDQIYVPAGCGDAYKTAPNWSNYADYIVEDTE